jgi:hypothetical protein
MKKKAPKSGKRSTSRQPKRPTDVNQVAHLLVERSTGEAEVIPEPSQPTQADISRVMSELGKRGGKIGGKRRADSMTPERRREIALKAARSRWDKNGQQ